ncbi:MAG: RidA family protein [Planctomycetes bacterium]|nr:RidA family protein [Planctomycetota bacterium]
MSRRVVSSGAPWESLYGYRRTVRVGNMVFVAGTAPVGDDGKTFAPGNATAQARRCFEIALRAMGELGGGPQHVVRTRMFVTDIQRGDEFGRVHGEIFGAHPPAATMVEVSALVNPDMLIEIELDAVVDQ